MAARLARREAALAARAGQTPEGPAPDLLRIATWNVNSIRTRADGIERFLERTRPDVLCLQETRIAEIPPAVRSMLERLGFCSAHAGSGGNGGVAVVARHSISEVECSAECADAELAREPRYVSCLVGCEPPLRVASVYVPHGRTPGHWHYDYKLSFLTALTRRAQSWLDGGESVVVAGDLNVAPTDSDVFHPDAFVGRTHVSPPERAAFRRFLATGLVDVDVACWGPRARRFTWWNLGIGYSRNLGMRIDIIGVDEALAERVVTTWIDHRERGAQRPSDHAALIADFAPVSASPR